ncbi:flagellar basal-body rod protein FlgG [Candidatus Phycosocius spiralis]|uniref:Flagellar basal-body rod protein FlgG n=1 Tax=Candidatus Phycosocius spiralis TaxID=2815099 RepID=A0ABQ4PWY6_9PROT|nr:flagellar basal-body rod protein FlgG [Candidatus Phycosocius spiralis]GIU67445.1 flagellar basal-body rod protein FlgG [Candidatus Phycosocius spiralis]
MRSMNIAATGMLAQQLNVEVISNNIANMNTTGFKRQRAEFQDLIYQNLERPGATTSDSGTIDPTGVQVGYGVKTGSVYRIAEQGSLSRTDNKFDLAINGRGYFQVLLPDGRTAYTRAGNFSSSPTGQIVTGDGLIVQPEIQIPEGALDFSVSPSGQVQAVLSGQTAPQDVGQLTLATFVNPAGLEALGDNLLVETAASGPATVGNPNVAGLGSINQSYVEASNVNPVFEISALIIAQRAYEMNSKVINATDEMMQATSQVLR